MIPGRKAGRRARPKPPPPEALPRWQGSDVSQSACVAHALGRGINSIGFFPSRSPESGTICRLAGGYVKSKLPTTPIFTWFCLAMALPVGVLGQAAPPAPLVLPMQPGQMILVVTKDWQAVDGRLQRFEFVGRAWQPVGPSIRIVVGRHGMAWGRGEHPMPQPGPQKKEGDGKSPAGVFDLRYAFGYEPPDKVPGIKLPYVQCTRGLECVDDHQILPLQPDSGAFFSATSRIGTVLKKCY